MIGHELKTLIGCKLVLNYHDPINFTSVNGVFKEKQINNLSEKKEKKILKAADLVITSTKSQEQYLLKKVPEIQEVKTFHFGYASNPIKKESKSNIDFLIFGYGGAMGDAQRIEPLVDLFSKQQKHELWLFGNYREADKLQKNDQVKLHGLVKPKEYVEIFSKQVDVGIVSLGNAFYAVCTPSKLYDYIAWEIPILGYLHEGEATQIIEQNGFGKVLHPNPNFEQFEEAISEFESTNKYNHFKENIASQKSDWSFDEKWKNVPKLLKEL